MNGWTDGRLDGWTDRQEEDERMDWSVRRMDRHIDIQTDEQKETENFKKIDGTLKTVFFKTTFSNIFQRFGQKFSDPFFVPR
jgi:hypothetical protein